LRTRNGAQHATQDLDPGFARLSERGPNDLFADALDLQVELNAGDAVLRTGDLEVHVAVVVFITDDVGQQGELVCFFDQPHRDAGNRVADGHARGHQAQGGTANAGHRARAV